MQVAATVFPAFGLGDNAVRGTIIVLAIGFVPALVFSWVFELTPEGLKRESEIDPGQSITVHTGKTMDRLQDVRLGVSWTPWNAPDPDCRKSGWC